MDWNFLQVVLAVALWTSLGCVFYAYVAYPALIYCLASWAGRTAQPPRCEFPPVSVLIAAHNEEKWIHRRVLNVLRQSYPDDRLQVVIASDGSSDRTAPIVAELALQYPGRIVLFDFAQRRGKANVLNDVIPRLTGEIVVLSDANTLFDRSAVSMLVRWFADNSVFAVCGKLELVDPATGRNVDGLYWRYENLLKACEAKLGALLGANGAVYAIRRAAYVAIPGDTIIDDFLIPLVMKLRSPGRLLYDAEAVATEETPPLVRDEFRRRARIGAGGFQSLGRLWPLLLPTAGWTSLAFVSHKVLRWFAPLLLLIGLAANLALAGDPLYRSLLAAQVAFYATAAICGILPGNSLPLRVLRLTTLFTSLNFALAVGFWRWLSGAQGGVWQRTAR